MCLRTLYKILFILIVSKCSGEQKMKMAQNFKNIELLAEQHPYVVGLLDGNTKYLCTGTIISEWSILTSGFCVNREPKYVSIGLAVLRRERNKKSLLIEVAYTRLHQDYLYDLNDLVPNLTNIHSNIGIVHVSQPIKDWYHAHAELGDYFASELEASDLKHVGFGLLQGSDSVVLQYQKYVVAPCANPKWYYCICGSEGPFDKTYETAFGNGGPVLYHSEVVGVTVTCCGQMWLRVMGPSYHVFTVTGPYISWIKKVEENMELVMRSHQCKAIHIRVNLYHYTYFIFFLLINYLLN